jgi:hypothetical protein
MKLSLDERTVFEVEDGMTRRIGENPLPSSAPWEIPDQYRNQDRHRDPGALSAAPAASSGPDQFGATPSPAIDFAVRIG